LDDLAKVIKKNPLFKTLQIAEHSSSEGGSRTTCRTGTRTPSSSASPIISATEDLDGSVVHAITLQSH